MLLPFEAVVCSRRQAYSAFFQRSRLPLVLLPCHGAHDFRDPRRNTQFDPSSNFGLRVDVAGLFRPSSELIRLRRTLLMWVAPTFVHEATRILLQRPFQCNPFFRIHHAVLRFGVGGFFDLRLHRAEDRLHLLHLPILNNAVNLISVPAQVHCCPRTRVHEDSFKSWIDRELIKLRHFFGSCSEEVWLFTNAFASSMGSWVNVGYSDRLHNVTTDFSVLDLTDLSFSASEFRDNCTSDLCWLVTCSGFLRGLQKQRVHIWARRRTCWVRIVSARISHRSPFCNTARFTIHLRLKLSRRFVKLQRRDLKWLLTKVVWSFHVKQSNQSVRLLTFVRTSAICLVVSTNLILDPCVKVDPVTQPIERSVMRLAETCLFVGASGPWWSSWSLYRCLRKQTDVLDGGEFCACTGQKTIFPRGWLLLVFFMHGNRPAWKFSHNQLPCPPNSVWELVPIKDQRLARFSLLWCCCEKRLSASCKSEQLVQVCNDQKWRTLRPR